MYFINESLLSNISFLVAGASIATITQLAVESARRVQQARDLARALYEELANRVARCLFDYEKPWEQWIDRSNCVVGEVDLLRLRKFIPIAPTIYPAIAGQIALLEGTAPQAVIRFFAALAIYQNDMTGVAQYCETNNFDHAAPDQICILAERLRRTLAPGLAALQALSSMVDTYEEIDAAAIGELDRLFKHERAQLTLRQRLEHYVKQTH